MILNDILLISYLHAEHNDRRCCIRFQLVSIRISKQPDYSVVDDEITESIDDHNRKVYGSFLRAICQCKVIMNIALKIYLSRKRYVI
jgi:hypothetical protein